MAPTVPAGQGGIDPQVNGRGYDQTVTHPPHHSPPPKGMIRMLAALASLVGLILVSCSSDSGAAGMTFKPNKPDVLTVATALRPVPGYWGTTADSATSGFEQDLARLLAERLKLESVDVVQSDFNKIERGDLAGADLALTQMSPTKAREKFVDFSDPYLTAPPGVLSRKGLDVADAANLKELRWVVVPTSTLTSVVTDQIRPKDTPRPVADTPTAIETIVRGEADAILLDLPSAQAEALAKPNSFEVAGQLGGSEGIAAAFLNGSTNVEIVDSTIRALTADGTIAELTTKWFGKAAADVPLIQVASS